MIALLDRVTLLDPVTRESAQDAARHELSRQPYADAQPNPVLRLIGRLIRALSHLIDDAAGKVTGGGPVRLVLLVLVIGVVALAVLRLGPLRRVDQGAALFGGSGARTAAQHRSEAESLAGQGRWAEAVRERLRAVVRELEERAVLDARPGRTADEVARDAGAAVPVLAADLQRAVAVFDEVWYGGRPADPAAYAVLVALDERVSDDRLRTVPA